MSFSNRLMEKFKQLKKGISDITEDLLKKEINCSEDVIPEKPESTGGTSSSKMDEITSSSNECGENMIAVIDKDGTESNPFSQDPCTNNKTRLLLEDISDSMGTGVDENAPAQEGFIPPHCYEMAKLILDYVMEKSLNANKDNQYNSIAVLLDDVIRSMRNQQEMAKFLITSKDDSAGSQALRTNTANNPKFNQIFMNKDIEDFRNTVFGKGV